MSVVALVATLLVAVVPVGAGPSARGVIGVNIVLNTTITDSILAELGAYGKVRDVLYQVGAVTLQARADQLPAIRALSFVAAANPDAVRTGTPVDTVFVEDFSNGLSTWNLDAINVTDYGFNNRQVDYDGTGVYVAVLDTGLLRTWRQYFPQERIATEYAMSFGGGGGEMSWVSSQPNKWERDVNSHGTHVTSTILGYSYSYSLNSVPINGVAPMATVIPVKVLNQNGSGGPRS
jgi:subtilisin family serine protease